MADLSLEDQALAAVDLIGRTGSTSFQFRYSDDEQPVIYMAVALYKGGKAEAAASLDPSLAIYRLLEAIIDGGQCVHCRRPTGVENDWDGRQPLEDFFCWYVYDPELKRYRRSCE